MITEMMPNAGRMMMYTSGWPKNQNTCWNRTGSPPPAALKNDVPKCRSVRRIVTAPRRVEERRAEGRIVEEHRHRAGKHGHHGDQQVGGDEPRPAEERQLHQ